MTLNTIHPFEQTFMLSPRKVNNDTPNFINAPRSPDSYLHETFHQYPHGDFRPTFYNPFEIKHRRRTSRAQLRILEDAFSDNSKPTASMRHILAQKLEMTPRGVQIWFQNRRAKEKTIQREPEKQKPSIVDEQDKQPLELNRPSVLFSQFFITESTRGTTASDHHPATIEDTSKWSKQSYKVEDVKIVNDNIRTLATTAAAVAAASSNMNHYQMNSFDSWAHHKRELQQMQANSMICKECKVCDNDNIKQEPAYTYTPKMDASMLSEDLPMNLYSAYDSKDFSLIDHHYQDVSLSYSQLLTPPLTATYSNAGSPVSFDRLYNDPIILPNSHNFFAQQSSNVHFFDSSMPF